MYVPESAAGSSVSTLNVAVAVDVYVFHFHLPLTFTLSFRCIVNVTVYTPAFDGAPTISDPFQESPGGSPFTAIPPTMSFEGFRVSVRFQGPMNPRNDGVCLCLQVGEGECWIVGSACGLTFSSAEAERPNLDLLQVEEGRFEEGAWIPGRRLNGDETASLSLEKPAVLHVKFFTYK